MFKLDSSFNKKILDGFKGSVEAIEEQTHREVGSKKWEHPRETTRSDGSVVSTPRDIVDTGDLDRSIGSEVQQDKGKVFADVDHAALVHQGYTTIQGNDVPPKPFLKSAVKEADRLGLVQDAFNKALR